MATISGKSAASFLRLNWPFGPLAIAEAAGCRPPVRGYCVADVWDPTQASTNCAAWSTHVQTALGRADDLSNGRDGERLPREARLDDRTILLPALGCMVARPAPLGRAATCPRRRASRRHRRSLVGQDASFACAVTLSFKRRNHPTSETFDYVQRPPVGFAVARSRVAVGASRALDSTSRPLSSRKPCSSHGTDRPQPNFVDAPGAKCVLSFCPMAYSRCSDILNSPLEFGAMLMARRERRRSVQAASKG